MGEVRRDQRSLVSRQGGLSPRVDFRRAFAGLSAGFMLASAAAAAVRSQQSFDHGWWLVAYLALVGGLSQQLLGVGQLALSPGLESTPDGRRALTAEIILWNSGALMVPVGVFAGAPGVVAAGSVVLLGALALFAGETRSPRSRRDRNGWISLYGYRAALIFLTGSVVVGTGLAEALPWQ